MLWNINDKGFLPACEPINAIRANDFNNTQLVYSLENLSYNLPFFLKERRLKEELVHELRLLSPTYGHGIIDRLGDQSEVERGFLLLSLFASAYSFGQGERPIYRTPKEVSIPLFRAAFLCRRAPVLTYTSYVLYNCKNSNVINTFTDYPLEQTLILTFLQIEKDLAKVINGRQAEDLTAFLEIIVEFFEKAVKQLADVRNDADVDELAVLTNYYRNFDNMFYEGMSDKHKPYMSEVFVQCPMFSLFYKLLGISFKDELVQKQEQERDYFTTEHNAFLDGIVSIRNLAYETDKTLYNKCIKSFISLHNEMFMLNDYFRWNSPRVKELNNHLFT